MNMDPTPATMVNQWRLRAEAAEARIAELERQLAKEKADGLRDTQDMQRMANGLYQAIVKRSDTRDLEWDVLPSTIGAILKSIASERRQYDEAQERIAELERQAAAMRELLKNGVLDIALERRKQVQKGYGPQHDDEHTDGSLASLAAWFVSPPELAMLIPLPEWAREYKEYAIYHKGLQEQMVIASTLLAAEAARIKRTHEPMPIPGDYMACISEDDEINAAVEKVVRNEL